MRRRAIVLGLVSTVAVVAVAAPAAAKNGGQGVKGDPIVDLRGKDTGGHYPTVDVQAKDNSFDPQNIRISVGVTVKWTNKGRIPHNIKAADSKQDFGKKFGVDTASFAPAKTYSFTFNAPGTYSYYCTLHGAPNAGMFGNVIVGNVKAGGSSSAAAKKLRSGTLRVPKDFKTVQQAVDSAKPGALVLVAPGVYHEAVTVSGEHKNIVIRGESRSKTVLDGDFSEEPGHENGFKVLANGVAIENMTARNFKSNGFYWTGVKGYRGSYLTSIRAGDYGIYAFDSVNGQFDHDYGAGSPDAGFYIGQCYPCNALMIDDEAEWNGLGYSGTNAGGRLYIVRSSFHHNRAGIVPNSGTGEKNPPERGTTMTGNLVYSNNNGQTAAIDIAKLAIGNGILFAGGNENVAQRNLVYDHDLSGIAAIPLPEKLINPNNPNAINFNAENNKILDNVVKDSRQFDIGIVSTIDSDTASGGNCASGNTFTTSMPANIEQVAPCTGTGSAPFKTDLARFASLLTRDTPAAADYKTVKLPDPPASALADMPNATKAKARPATNEPSIKIKLASIKVPQAPATTTTTAG
ncbi:MAG: plastocyanin/azurin family copper-binding protein [Acidimicrobiia bacterium]